VSIRGRTVGVIHATAEPHAPVTEDTIADVATLAKLAGARIGLLRVMAETQLQASTDSLTGLLNRRSFEQRLSVIRRETPVLSLAIADLDHFKDLNDTYGHETGDRALRLFAQVLTGSVRAHDLVAATAVRSSSSLSADAPQSAPAPSSNRSAPGWTPRSRWPGFPRSPSASAWSRPIATRTSRR